MPNNTNFLKYNSLTFLFLLRSLFCFCPVFCIVSFVPFKVLTDVFIFKLCINIMTNLKGIYLCLYSIKVPCALNIEAS